MLPAIRRALILVAVIGVTAVGVAAMYRYGRSANPLQGAAGAPTSASIELQPCEAGGQTAYCGSLAVFEDRTAARGRKIAIKFVVLQIGRAHV